MILEVHFSFRPPVLAISCMCMKTATESGQAWRGYERALIHLLIDMSNVWVAKSLNSKQKEEHMKKLTLRQRKRDVKRSIMFRRGQTGKRKKGKSFYYEVEWRKTNYWIDEQSRKGLDVQFVSKKKKGLILTLPPVMDFSNNYAVTVQHINAIRMLSERKGIPSAGYQLASVNFCNLKKISTSAALVLTAELSKWDDALRQRLTPKLAGWDIDILRNFYELGFFDLFKKSKSLRLDFGNESPANKGKRFVKYLKGKCGEVAKTKVLKGEIIDLVGESIEKWIFLHSGLSEAITNVSHHAYPVEYGYKEYDKNWYLTGSYNIESKVLKIVFYDQGVGIPKTLPASKVWEKALTVLAKISSLERYRDEELLKAAVELDRTSTEEDDRGKGLQDLLEFIRQRENGYLSIMSLKGLYKHSMNQGITKVKTESFASPICGTLIIWSVSLE
ncbi:MULTISPECIES: hypothetical protein [Klebsiella]|uniref:hypothetical protein n=1 Tax=Klebsiella TaxID=570 RepID=UPI00163CF7AE|nr:MULTISPECIES: hypothetical protein [Klebsiella]MDL4445542.1 hypothetical protein [Klebsiella michiganensis]MDL4485566.1 hypothetical protein [Klebsiella michiganensis]MDL4660405.1 hypothetical protein [Klebsiella michiganensis]